MSVKSHTSTASQGSEQPPFASSQAWRSAANLVLEAVRGIGLFDADFHQETASEREQARHLRTVASHCSVYGMAEELWIDIVVESELKTAEALFCQITGMPSSTPEDGLDFLGEVANFVRGGLRKKMAETGETLAPYTPKEVPSGNIAMVHRYPCPKVEVTIQEGENRLWVTLLFSSKPVERKTIESLRDLDISVESIPNQHGSSLEILAKGVVLSHVWVEKLRTRFMQEPKQRLINVVTPPPVVSLLHRVVDDVNRNA